MGWASGSELAERVWDDVRTCIPSEIDRRTAAKRVIEAFEDMDCDTIGECEQLVKDAGLEAEYWPDDEDEE